MQPGGRARGGGGPVEPLPVIPLRGAVFAEASGGDSRVPQLGHG